MTASTPTASAISSFTAAAATSASSSARGISPGNSPTTSSRQRGDGVVYLDEEDDDVVFRECWKPAVLLKGRSYMYGLEDGELPDLPGGCHSEQRAAPGAALRRVQP